MAEYFFGGARRMANLHKLFQTCVNHSCKVLILTRNSNIGVIGDLMRTFELEPPLTSEVRQTTRSRNKLDDLRTLEISRGYCDKEKTCRKPSAATVKSDESSSDSSASSSTSLSHFSRSSSSSSTSSSSSSS
jgi:hypothetical protein